MKWLDLKVGGQKVSVHVVKPAHKDLGEGVSGAYDPDKNRISISSELEPSVREDTLFHELDHAVNNISGANHMLRAALALKSALNPDEAEAALETLEEQLVRARTPIWHRLLKDLGFHFPRGLTE